MRLWKLLLPFVMLCAPTLHAQAVLNANPGPSNNGGGAGSAIFFDVEATSGAVITGLTTATDADPGENFQMRVYTRDGSALGGTLETGPGSSSEGWILRGTVTGTQGKDEVSLPIGLPELTISAGRTMGIALQFVDISQNYFGTGTAPIEDYSYNVLTLRTGDARAAPFTTTGLFFSSRALVGSLIYRLADPELVANAGPSNNTAAPNSGLFFNLQSSTGVVVNGLEIASQAVAGASYQIEVYTRAGTALGNTQTTGPATSPAGWTLQGPVDAIQGAGQISLPIALPPLTVAAGQTVGVGLVFRGAGLRYFGTGSPPVETYSSPGLVLTTGEARSAPFTGVGNQFASRALVGKLFWHPLRQTLNINQGPSNNGGAIGAGMFLDLMASTPLSVNSLRLASTSVPNSNFQVRMFTRAGSALGSTSGSGPSSSSAGWTLHATLNVVQAATGEVSLPVSFPELQLNAGQTLGIGLVFDNAEPRYFGSGLSPLGVYSGNGLSLVSGEARQPPFVVPSTLFVSRELVGTVYFRTAEIFKNGFE